MTLVPLYPLVNREAMLSSSSPRPLLLTNWKTQESGRCAQQPSLPVTHISNRTLNNTGKHPKNQPRRLQEIQVLCTAKETLSAQRAVPRREMFAGHTSERALIPRPQKELQKLIPRMCSASRNGLIKLRYSSQKKEHKGFFKNFCF